MNLPSLGIIILHWNHVDNTLRCLESVYSSDYSNYQVLVVDNGSDDPFESKSPSIDSLRQSDPDLAILETGQNLGYSGGNNSGIRYFLKQSDKHNDKRSDDLPVDYFLLLNDDTILNQQTLSNLAAAALNHPQAGFLGPKIFALEEPGVVLSAGGKLSDSYRVDHLEQGKPANPFRNQAEEVDFLSGCALLVKREVAENIGLLDEDFFNYYEEIDWCYRGRQAGYEIYLAPDASVWHPDTRQRDENSPAVTYYSTRNRLLFARKHRLGWMMLIRMLAGYSRQYLSWSLRPKWKAKTRQRQALAQALLDFTRRRKGKWGPSP